MLTVRYMSARAAGGTRGIGRFIRYIQYRDVHPDSEPLRDLDGLIRYVHHRDPLSPSGQMFNAVGPASDDHRREFVQYVARSTERTPRVGRPRSTTSERAVYRFVLSPKDARGLDLKRLTRAAMTQLATDTGHAHLPPWIAGEHRNTAHPHVHVILAARREMRTGDFRTLLITRNRLIRMKEALRLEMTRQRERRLGLTMTALRSRDDLSDSPGHARRPRPEIRDSSGRSLPSLVETIARTPSAHEPFRQQMRHRPSAMVVTLAARMSRHHRREAERLARRRHPVWDDVDRRVRRLP